MKKLVYYLPIVFLFCFISCQNRIVAGKIYHSVSVDIRRLDYSIVKQEEEWLPNGDGQYHVQLSFANSPAADLDSLLSQMKKIGALNLPIKNVPTIMLNELDKYKQDDSQGLYLLQVDSLDYRNYSVLVIDTENKSLYFQVYIY